MSCFFFQGFRGWFWKVTSSRRGWLQLGAAKNHDVVGLADANAKKKSHNQWTRFSVLSSKSPKFATVKIPWRYIPAFANVTVLPKRGQKDLQGSSLHACTLSLAAARTSYMLMVVEAAVVVVVGLILLLLLLLFLFLSLVLIFLLLLLPFWTLSSNDPLACLTTPSWSQKLVINSLILFDTSANALRWILVGQENQPCDKVRVLRVISCNFDIQERINFVCSSAFSDVPEKPTNLIQFVPCHNTNTVLGLCQPPRLLRMHVNLVVSAGFPFFFSTRKLGLYKLPIFGANQRHSQPKPLRFHPP